MAMTKNPPIVGRLAPSPTGGLHVGHARTFLLAWLSARSAGGRMILRIEDIDAQRVRPGASEAMIEDLRWLGLDWDEGPDVGGPHAPYLQSRRTELYEATLARLKAEERVYPCICTRADISRAASAPHAGEEGPAYPGTCRGRSVADAQNLADRPFSWRFRVPSYPYWFDFASWTDLVLGPTIPEFPGGGDFVVGRSTGEPSYQLAVVCDDAAMGVTRVIRGADLIPSTPRQILLYIALGWPEPEFGHVPLVLGPDGKRLAKRDGSIKLATLRDSGIDPRELVGRIAASCGLAGGPAWPEDLIAGFSLGAVPMEPWTMSTTGH